jgi:predicted nuclease of predicted toxin-antitoxin system
MRFVLDHDVDVAVGQVLRAAGHDCWTAAEALSDPDDDAIAVCADEKGAAVIAHDREFADRRRRQTFGQHVRLACPQPDAVEVIRRRLRELIEKMKAGVGVYVVTKEGVEFHPPRWE